MLTNLLLFAILLLIAAVAIKLWSVGKQLMAKASKADLDAAIAALPATLKTALEAAIQPIIDALNAKASGADIDFSDEVSKLQAVPATVASQVAADLTPATPTPAPAPAPPEPTNP